MNGKGRLPGGGGEIEKKEKKRFLLNPYEKKYKKKRLEFTISGLFWA